MLWRDYYNLPERFAAHVPAAVTQAIVAFGMVVLTIGIRLVIDLFFRDVVAFALVFPAIVMATLLAGPRSGVLTLIGCQLTVWYFLLPIQRSFVFETAGNLVSLILTTIAEALMLWFVASYRSAVRTAADFEKQRLAAKDFALRELDHRTRNNFQIAGALLQLHASRTDLPQLRDELTAAASRLTSIAAVHEHLSRDPSGMGCVSLKDYLEEVCSRLRIGLADDGVLIAADVAPLEVSHELALHLGLIVNELVTNALKHAFVPCGGGWINVTVRQEEDELLLRVADNGIGCPGAGTTAGSRGIGTKLVDMLAQAVEGTVTRKGETGLIVEIRVPVGASGDHSMAAALYGNEAPETQFLVSRREQAG